MNRRTLLAGVGGGVAVGLGARFALSSDGPDTLEPATVDAVGPDGGDAGAVTVPGSGVPTVVDLFATSCRPCDDQVAALSTARERLDVDATFVSVSNELVGERLTRRDVADWFADAGGTWTVALDDDSTLIHRLGAREIPFTAVVAPDGRVTWSESGVTSADRVVEEVRAVA
ncbi:TlpA family protein disulfide reductase [Haloarchaeobius sp. HRN-SO-5]|uniref:TlpA family protein disulfide reductase n=1 Tax=Haloarchaeobius sp. HRN-SO-5 TaxID=3446118 RepID=UPI003EB9544E